MSERDPAGPAQSGVAPAEAVLGRVMLAFRGATVPAWLRKRLGAAPVAGVTLFRPYNVRSPRQVRALTSELQAAAGAASRGGSGAAAARTGAGLPILIAADQEGGQLLALSGEGWTQFAGPMAIGATGDAGLAERVGRAIGRELRASGVNVNYAPCLDVASNPLNPALGIRSFGDDPDAVAELGAAWLRGAQSAGVAATAKHFPGKGEGSVDTHLELDVVERDRAGLRAIELRPFEVAVGAGVRMVMSGHFAVPAITGSRTLPSTLAPQVMGGLLRDELGFAGVSITDALDMGALPQDATQAVDVVAALRAGVDLLLATADRAAQRRIEAAIVRAAELGLLDDTAGAASLARVEHLRQWIAGFEPPPVDVIGCEEHRALERELAERSVTLVRDGGLLPLRLPADASVLAVIPAPRDLTPADTSSYVRPGLAAAIRAHHPRVEEIVTSHPPTDEEIAAVRRRAAAADLVIVGTISAAPDSPQASLVEAVIATRRPLVTVALRTPWDLAAYPAATTHVCTYSILPASLQALAAGLFGRFDFRGRLPVGITGLHHRGHGLVGVAS
jgi:beta-N-acetylhexosaminidase